MKKTITTMFACAVIGTVSAQTDAGPRNGPQFAGQPIVGLSAGQLLNFNAGRTAFEEVDDVADGLGPRFNLDSCVGCHAQPSTGGTSPAVNPQISAATRNGARNVIPPFLQPNGPVRVVRFKRLPNGQPDGGVHALFTITGRVDTPPGCNIAQPDFSQPQNLSLRIPTPLFGAGLMEAISDTTLRGNLAANGPRKRMLGIQGTLNSNGNDGTTTRFGWKAQNKSLAIFAGEAYNVEVGVTNELFPQERDETPACLATAKSSPQDRANLDTGEYSDVDLFTFFMRFLAPPAPAASSPSIDRGRNIFDSVGCAMCHTPSLITGKSVYAALSEKPANLYSDLALHRMGQGLADGVSQGDAAGDQFRTAPLWGVGQRLFFMHDGRSRDLMDAIRQHDSRESEAHSTVMNFNSLPPEQKQDVLNFLRSL